MRRFLRDSENDLCVKDGGNESHYTTATNGVHSPCHPSTSGTRRDAHACVCRVFVLPLGLCAGMFYSVAVEDCMLEAR